MWLSITTFTVCLLAIEGVRLPHGSAARNRRVDDDDDAPFSKFCLPFPGKRVVLVTANDNYSDMFLNWYESAKRYLKPHDQLVVVAEDDAVVSMLKRKNFTFIHANGTIPGGFFHPLMIERSARSTPWEYGSPAYNSLVSERPGRIKYFLRLGCTVLYTDVDLVWTDDVYKSVAALGHHDVIVSDDDKHNGGFRKGYLCTCIMYMQPTLGSRLLMSKWFLLLNMPGKKTTNQIKFNQALKMLGSWVDHAVLPFEQFPPGCSADKFPKQRRWIHANYMMGKDVKINFLRDRGQWFLDRPNSSKVMG